MSDIIFPNIPTNELIPLFQLEFGSSAYAGLPNQVSLIIGQTTNNASDNAPSLIPNTAWAANNWGPRSVIASMAERYLGADPYGQLWGLGVADNGAGAAATGSIVVSGTATAAGTLNLYIAGRYVPVAVNIGDTAGAVMSNAAAAINLYLDSSLVNRYQARIGDKGVKLPLTASASGGPPATTLNLTASHKGTLGNAINIALNYFASQNQEVTPAGLTVVITAMSGGTTDPLTNGFAAALGNTAYDFICMPWATTQALLDFKNLMLDATGRWSWAEQIYGHVWTARTSADNSGSDALSFASGSYADDQHMTCVQCEFSVPSTQWDIAATYMAASAASLRADPALPLQTLYLPSLMAPRRHQEFTFAVKQELLAAGVALMNYAPDRSCSILRAVTTYTINPFGSPDASYRDTETLYTSMAVVRQLKADCLAKFSRAKLASNGYAFGKGKIATPKSIRAQIIASYRGMEKAGLVENVTGFANGLVVQRNSLDATRVDVLFDPNYVSGLRVLANLVQFSLR